MDNLFAQNHASRRRNVVVTFGFVEADIVYFFAVTDDFPGATHRQPEVDPVVGIAVEQHQQIVAAFEKHAKTFAVGRLNPVNMLAVERNCMSEIRVFFAQ